MVVSVFLSLLFIVCTVISMDSVTGLVTGYGFTRNVMYMFAVSDTQELNALVRQLIATHASDMQRDYNVLETENIVFLPQRLWRTLDPNGQTCLSKPL